MTEGVYGSYRIQYYASGNQSYSCRLCSYGTNGPEQMALHLAAHALASLGLTQGPDPSDEGREDVYWRDEFGAPLNGGRIPDWQLRLVAQPEDPS